MLISCGLDNRLGDVGVFRSRSFSMRGLCLCLALHAVEIQHTGRRPARAPRKPFFDRS
jgi:hypothetical protein